MMKLGPIALLLVTTVAAGGSSAQEPNRDMPPAERAACVARGGVVKRMGIMGIEACEERYADAGKVCRAQKDCTAQCLYSGDPEKAPRRPRGKCQPTNNAFGCYAFIDNERHVRQICVD